MLIGDMSPIYSPQLIINPIPLPPVQIKQNGFGHYFVKSLKKDASGITSLRENGILKTEANDKANICNAQFQSAFTREADGDLPSKGQSPFIAMDKLTVDPNGVIKQLNRLNIHKCLDLMV